MHRRRQQLGISFAGTLASLALGLLGCPQLLQDDFLTEVSPDPGGGVPDPPSQVGDGRAGAAGAGNGASGTGGAGNGSAGSGSPGSGSAGNGSAGSAGTAGSGGASPLPDAGDPTPAPPDGGPAACVAAAEVCDGLDNDCDELIDEASACASDCAGVLLEGRGGMFCAGSGATFASAESRCAAQGMRPVVVDSAQKSAAVLEAVEPLYAGLSIISEDQSSIWIDAHDGETEGTWHWGPSGPVFWIGDATGSAQNGAYVSWASGKPNNSGTGEGEDCAVLHAGVGPDPLGSWNDETCDGLHSFLCQAALP